MFILLVIKFHKNLIVLSIKFQIILHCSLKLIQKKSDNKIIKTIFVGFLIVSLDVVANLATGLFPFKHSAYAIDLEQAYLMCFGMLNSGDNNVTDNSDNSDNSRNDSGNTDNSVNDGNNGNNSGNTGIPANAPCTLSLS